MSTFQFIHTGDIHLDSPLRGLSGQEGPAAERIRTATRTAFEDLITQAIDRQAAFVVIAGDLYDGDWRDFHTGLFFVRQMGRLRGAKIPAFVLHGNHDAESQITKRLTLPDNVEVFSYRKPQTFKLDDCRVALHGQSFRLQATTENLAAAYPAPIKGYFNIGVLHTALGGMGGSHENYAPCTLEELVNKGYDYWALAHVHQGGVLHRNPHVVFCGNLQGRHIREAGPKSAQLVTVQDGAIEGAELLQTDVVRWMHVDVPVSGSARFGDVVDQIKRSIDEAAKNAEGRLLACRIKLTGPTALHAELMASAPQLLAEARAAALALGEEVAWIERVINATVPTTAVSIQTEGSAINDLKVLLAQAAGDSDLQAEIANDLGDLVRRLPHDAALDIDDFLLEAVIAKQYSVVIEQAGEYLSARLTAERR
ncbi:metallophosphoesterase family protein [Bradyrhizobium sp. CCBAU 25338]|uniref:metallophosphoesterase family protein n=1 Tax=Bradyrhizobium sp. CCBAU 25338 TaxID=1641877 RepID=UPI002302A4E0|nr:DNA repair exonuclease [Bradyrhizobium sp. CCBAU 25338]MDA9527263.1 metallophosphoesterase [Bradyrhizobium sp. CCBAU 25338]